MRCACTGLSRGRGEVRGRAGAEVSGALLARPAGGGALSPIRHRRKKSE